MINWMDGFTHWLLARLCIFIANVMQTRHGCAMDRERRLASPLIRSEFCKRLKRKFVMELNF